MAARKTTDETPPNRQELLQNKQRRTAKMKEEIQELMALKGWKQLDLAIALKVGKSTVWRWIECGIEPIPSLQTTIRDLLADARKRPKQARAETHATAHAKQPA